VSSETPVSTKYSKLLENVEDNRNHLLEDIRKKSTEQGFDENVDNVDKTNASKQKNKKERRKRSMSLREGKAKERCCVIQ